MTASTRTTGNDPEAERAQALRKRAAQGDKAAQAQLDAGENTPFGGDEVMPHDPGPANAPPDED